MKKNHKTYTITFNEKRKQTGTSLAKVSTIVERHRATKKFFQECQRILNKKGVNYNPRGDAFSGFKDNGKELGIEPRKVLWIMAAKHYRAIVSYLNGTNESEPIKGRLMDLANYAALLSVMIESEYV